MECLLCTQEKLSHNLEDLVVNREGTIRLVSEGAQACTKPGDVRHTPTLRIGQRDGQIQFGIHVPYPGEFLADNVVSAKSN